MICEFLHISWILKVLACQFWSVVMFYMVASDCQTQLFVTPAFLEGFEEAYALVANDPALSRPSTPSSVMIQVSGLKDSGDETSDYEEVASLQALTEEESAEAIEFEPSTSRTYGGNFGKPMYDAEIHEIHFLQKHCSLQCPLSFDGIPVTRSIAQRSSDWVTKCRLR